jgi:O-glycosyl hydrolase
MSACIKKAWKFSTVLLILLGLTLSFVGCMQEPADEEETFISEAAVQPVITTQPRDAEYNVGDDADPLRIDAAIDDSGTLSYQWYVNTSNSNTGGESINNAAAISYKPPTTTDGIFYYYAVVTNTNSTARIKTATTASDVAIVIVNDANAANYPVITAQPDNVFADAGGGGTFTITANAPSPGVLSYQWYSNTANSSLGGTLLPGETNQTLTVTGVSATTYYYVIVTNTDNTVSGRKTSSVTSAVRAVLIANATVTVDTSTKYQYVRGFGGMHGSWNTQSGQDVSVQDIEIMFNPTTGLGYNIFRMMIYPYSLEPNWEGTGKTEWENKVIVNGQNTVNTNHDNSDWYDIIKKVNSYNGYVLASPWTMLAEWKTNDSTMGGGNLKPEFYSAYATHLKRFAQLMYDNGAPIYAISIQNEPNYRANYDGCEWEPDEMRDFFKQVGHFTDGVPGYGGGQSIASVKTMNGETANNPNINDSALNDETSAAAIDLIGRHIYGSAAGEYTLAKTKGKEVWMTEHNVNSSSATGYPNDSTWNYVWKFMNEVDLTMRINKESAFVWWYSKRFYSMIGDGEYGTTEHAVLPRGYGLSHYAKFAKETNHVAVTVTGKNAGGANLTVGGNNHMVNQSNFSVDTTGAKITAYESPDGNTISLVMFTPTDTTGANGQNLGTVKIQLPAGFTATSATAMRSTVAAKGIRENVALSADGNSAIVTLPASNILSVRFTK